MIAMIERTFLDCLAAINEIYVDDTGPYLRRTDPAWSKRVDDLTARIDEIWIKAQAGQLVLSEFRRVAGDLYRAWKAGIELFKSSGQDSAS